MPGGKQVNYIHNPFEPGYKGYCLFPADFCDESTRTDEYDGPPGILNHVRPYISLCRSDESGWLIGYLPGDCDLDVDQVKDAEESAAYCRGIIDNVIRVEPDVARAKEVYDDAQVEVAFILNSMENRHADDVASKG
jgi:hypothetical protein